MYYVGNCLNVGAYFIAFRFCMSFFGVVSLVQLNDCCHSSFVWIDFCCCRNCYMLPVNVCICACVHVCAMLCKCICVCLFLPAYRSSFHVVIFCFFISYFCFCFFLLFLVIDCCKREKNNFFLHGIVNCSYMNYYRSILIALFISLLPHFYYLCLTLSLSLIFFCLNGWWCWC